MPELKSPMFIAGLVITVVVVVVVIMLYRTVSSLKSSVFSVVEQHNNAKGVLDSHESALKRIEDVLVGGDEEYDDEEEEPHDLPQHFSEPMQEEPGSTKKSK